MSNHSNFPGSGQMLNGSRTMTQLMSPTSTPVQSNTDSGGKGNRRFATLDDLKTNSSDGREAPVPIAPSPVEYSGNDSADQAAEQSNHDQRSGDNEEVVMQYGNISLDDNHQTGRNIFDFGGGVENQSTGADEAEAENSESTDQVTESSDTGQSLGGTPRSRISTTIKPIPLTSSTAAMPSEDYSDRHDARQSDIPPRWAAVPRGSDLYIDDSQGNFNIGNNQENGASVYINISGQKETERRDPGTPKISTNDYRPTITIQRSQFNLNFGEGQINEGSRVEF